MDAEHRVHQTPRSPSSCRPGPPPQPRWPLHDLARWFSGSRDAALTAVGRVVVGRAAHRAVARPGSGRARVAAAATGDTVDFAPSLVGKTITITSGLIPVVGKDARIKGPGADKLTLSGGGSSHLLGFFQDRPAGSPILNDTLSGLTLADAVTNDFGGGAIVSFNANLTLSADVFRNDTAAGGGGDLFAETSAFGAGSAPITTVTILDSQFLGISSAGHGVAISANDVAFVIGRSTFRGNTSSTWPRPAGAATPSPPRGARGATPRGGRSSSTRACRPATPAL